MRRICCLKGFRFGMPGSLCSFFRSDGFFFAARFALRSCSLTCSGGGRRVAHESSPAVARSGALRSKCSSGQSKHHTFDAMLYRRFSDTRLLVLARGGIETSRCCLLTNSQRIAVAPCAVARLRLNYNNFNAACQQGSVSTPCASGGRCSGCASPFRRGHAHCPLSRHKRPLAAGVP